MKRISKVLSFLLVVAFILSITCVSVFAETNKAEEYYNTVIAKDAISGMFHLDSVAPKDSDIEQQQFILDYFFSAKYSNDNYDVYAAADYDNPDRIVIYISYWEDANAKNDPNIYVEPDATYSQEIKITYNPVSPEMKAIADKYVKILNPSSEGGIIPPAQIRMNDMDMINLLFNVGDGVDVSILINYSSEFKKLMENLNFSAEFAQGAGGSGVMSSEAFGGMGLIKDGTVYGVANVFFSAANLFFVPDSTEDTTDAIAVAAKTRIEGYLGKEVKVEFAGPITEKMQEDISILGDVYGTEDYDFDTYYNITIDGKAYPFFIYRDSSKMIDISFGTKDVTSGAKITADSPNVPNDSMIEYTVIDKNAQEAKDLLADFGLTDGQSFDISLSSKSKGTYISKLEDGSFKVYIPFTDELKGKELTAYYKAADGKIEKFEVTVEGDYAVFSTTHFSTYTIGFIGDNSGVDNKTGGSTASEEKIAKTADTNSIALFGATMVVSLAGIIVIKKKEK